MGPLGRGGEAGGRGLRSVALLLPVHHREPPRAGRLQGPRGALPRDETKEAALRGGEAEEEGPEPVRHGGLWVLFTARSAAICGGGASEREGMERLVFFPPYKKKIHKRKGNTGHLPAGTATSFLVLRCQSKRAGSFSSPLIGPHQKIRPHGEDRT